MKRFVLATHNPGKLAEMASHFAALRWSVVGSGDLGIAAPVELTHAEGATFASNATLKAEHACRQLSEWVLADDSGLCVDALGGRPGVDSAHFGGHVALLKALTDLPDEQRAAHFMCVLALARPGEATLLFEGRVDGRIAMQARGDNGFGFDPVFIPENGTRTFADMARDEKDAISHRGRALAHFDAWLRMQDRP